MIAEHKTEDGWTLTVYSSLYMDWGLTITRPDGSELMTNPHCLSCESYGVNPPDGMDWDEAIREGVAYTLAVPWTEAEWIECLASQADELIEGYGGWDE
jgi:hypothetical protein